MRGDFRQGQQDEGTGVHARMGKNRAGVGAGDDRVIGEKVQLEHARRIGRGPAAAESALDLQTDLEHGHRGTGCAHPETAA